MNRRGGSLGASIVSWKIRSNSSEDVDPSKGHLNFTEGQTSNDIIVSVLADEIPEFDETLVVDVYEVSRNCYL